MQKPGLGGHGSCSCGQADREKALKPDGTGPTLGLKVVNRFQALTALWEGRTLLAKCLREDAWRLGRAALANWETRGRPKRLQSQGPQTMMPVLESPLRARVNMKTD